MNDLKLLIDSLNDDEVGGYLAFAKARNKRTHTHNLKLFKLLKAGKTQQLDLDIYAKPNANALYALKNRLRNSIIEFIAIQGFQSDQKEEMSILKWLLASRILLEKGHLKIGYQLLQKCESHALEHELYALLNEVYLSSLEYSHHLKKIDYYNLESKFQKNQAALKTSSAVALLFAHYKNKPDELPVDKVLFVKQKLQEYEIVINHKLSFKSLFQLLEITTDAATAAGNYHSITHFVNQVHEIIQEKQSFIDKNIWYYLECLFLIALTAFRTKDFKTSQRLLDELVEQLNGQNKTIKQRFQERSQLLKALCLHYTGRNDQALELLSEFKQPTFDTILIKTLCLFSNGSTTQAHRTINLLNRTDIFYEKSHAPALVLKKNLLELLLLIDLEKWELADSRLISLRKKCNQGLQGIDPRIKVFIKLITAFTKDPNHLAAPKFQNALDKLIVYDYEEDVFAVSFYSWIKSKVTGEKWYNTTLELVSKFQNLN